MSKGFPSILMIDGEVLFRQGTAAEHFYLIERGKVLLLDQSGQAVLRSYEADQVFGLPEVLAGALWPHTAVVSGATAIRVFPGKLLFEQIDKMPAAHQDFMNVMAKLAI
jgi:CRP-like cAMP-binding protein